MRPGSVIFIMRATSGAHPAHEPEVGAPKMMLTSAYTNSIWMRNRIVELLRSRLADQRGAALVEYAFLVSFIAMVCLAAVTLLGSNNNASATHSAQLITAAN
jgi:Flp pilus assembly pilin Flp